MGLIKKKKDKKQKDSDGQDDANAKLNEANDDKFQKLPQGVPGRKSFKFIPDQKKFWRPEALALRKMLMYMMPVHMFVLLIIDIFVYSFELFAIIMEVILLWLTFYGYMTLNKVTTGAYVGLLLMSSVVALTHSQRILLSESTSIFMIVAFIIQYFVIYPVAASLIAKRLKAHYE